MFDLNQFGNAGKKLNADFLKTMPKMAVKGIISGGGVAQLKKDDGSPDPKPFLSITSPVGTWEGEKELILNATNRNILKATYGDQPNAWIGKEIGIYFDPTVTFGGKAIGGVKVKGFAPDPFADTPPVAAHTVADATGVSGADLPF
jgi:hypothetical protein